MLKDKLKHNFINIGPHAVPVHDPVWPSGWPRKANSNLTIAVYVRESQTF